MIAQSSAIIEDEDNKFCIKIYKDYLLIKFSQTMGYLFYLHRNTMFKLF